jgi:hypothetical protein
VGRVVENRDMVGEPTTERWRAQRLANKETAEEIGDGRSELRSVNSDSLDD